MSIQQIKDHIRRRILNQRRQLQRDQQQDASRKICAQIQALSQYQKAEHVAFYFAIQGEVDLSSLWHPFPQNKTCYLPRFSPPKSLLFSPFTASTVLHRNQWDIPEPCPSVEQVTEEEFIQIIFLPLVAFDEQGTRIGMGGGYYDSYLATNTYSLRIGVAYEFQKQAYIPSEPWDKFLHAVITEISTYWFSEPNLLS